jgi:hypothetical protein
LVYNDVMIFALSLLIAGVLLADASGKMLPQG